MTTRIGLSFGAIIILGITACSGRQHRSSYPTYSGPTYSGPTYSGTTYSTPAESVPGTVVEVANPPPTGKPFPTPQAAIAAVHDALGTHDKAKAEEIFGTGATEVLWSGDDVADKENALRVKSMIEAGVTFEDTSAEETVAAVGKDKWPFPIPLVKTPEGWRFDLEAGKDELLSRRIGRNELETISTMYEYVQAQKEYYAAGRDGKPPAYAQKVRSTEGKHDGLYWASAEGEPESPFGEFIAEAQKAGYAASETPQPFNGYYYKILTSQGANAPGGKKNYVDARGNMNQGFAAIAWPASYGNSGIMTFIVSATGVVFERDLGEQTETVAPTITQYDPDKSWRPSARKPLDEDEAK